MCNCLFAVEDNIICLRTRTLLRYRDQSTGDRNCPHPIKHTTHLHLWCTSHQSTTGTDGLIWQSCLSCQPATTACHIQWSTKCPTQRGCDGNSWCLHDCRSDNCSSVLCLLTGHSSITESACCLLLFPILSHGRVGLSVPTELPAPEALPRRTSSRAITSRLLLHCGDISG